MQQISDEELLKLLKNIGSEFYTLADIHKTLIQSNIQTTIEELRKRIYLLFRDGYLGDEPTGDGVHLYFIIYCPDY